MSSGAHNEIWLVLFERKRAVDRFLAQAQTQLLQQSKSQIVASCSFLWWTLAFSLCCACACASHSTPECMVFVSQNAKPKFCWCTKRATIASAVASLKWRVFKLGQAVINSGSAQIVRKLDAKQVRQMNCWKNSHCCVLTDWDLQLNEQAFAIEINQLELIWDSARWMEKRGPWSQKRIQPGRQGQMHGKDLRMRVTAKAHGAMRCQVIWAQTWSGQFQGAGIVKSSNWCGLFTSPTCLVPFPQVPALWQRGSLFHLTTSYAPISPREGRYSFPVGE